MTLFLTAWYRGEIVPTESLPIQPAWEPWEFKGRGVFTTTRTFLDRDCLAFWPKHLERLSSTLAEIGVACPSRRRGHDPTLDMPALALGHAAPEREIVDWVKTLNVGDLCVRVNVVEGHDPWVVARPLPPTPIPTKLSISSEPPTPDRRLKLVAQEWRRNAEEEATTKGVWDVIATYPKGRVFDTSRANLLLRLGNEWYAAWAVSNDGGMLPGIVVTALVQQKSIAGEGAIRVDQFDAADEIVCTNSVRGIVPIHEVEGRAFTPGEATKKLQEWFDRAAVAHAR